jgi:glucuronate isomerase
MAVNVNLDTARLMPVEESVRALAEALYAQVKDLPVISPHGHVEARLLLDNQPFPNPAELFLFFDHYVTRVLHSAGIPLEQITKSNSVDPRQAWGVLASNWHLLAGTSSGYWLTHEFATLFGISQTPNAENADELYDLISTELLEPRMLPRALFKKFNIEFLATTDDPCDDLAAHRALAEDSSFNGRVVPTFRPDTYLDPRNAKFGASLDRLFADSNNSSKTYAEYVQRLAARRRYFIEHGALSTDHGVYEPYTTILSQARASELFDQAVAGTISATDAREFAGHMLTEMARMSTEDGLVMTIHAGVFRNHSSATFKKFGPDTGHDIPVAVEFVNNLSALLGAYGLHPKLKVILFSIDEANWGREIAPLAGFYPSVFIGAPWWFLDAPDSAMRFREKVTEIAGFYKGSGFIDDTRAFLSIQARHDMARRIDCSYLARLVAQGRITLQQAEKIAHDLVVSIPKRAFNL